MSADPQPQDIRTIWQQQDVEISAMTLLEIRERARAFDVKIRRRNLREYIAATFVIPAWGWLAWSAPNGMSRLGLILILASSCFTLWQIKKRGPVNATLPEGQPSPVIDAYLQALTRRRDFALSMPRWALLPIVPGTALLFLGRLRELWVPGQEVTDDVRMLVMGALGWVLIAYILWLRASLAASKFQREIDELNRLKPDQ